MLELEEKIISLDTKFEKNLEITKKSIKAIKKDIQKVTKAIELLHLQSGMPDHFPTYEVYAWIGVGGNCYSYAANDKLFDWILNGSTPCPGFTKGKAYTHEDPWKRVAAGVSADSHGRARVVSYKKQKELFVVPFPKENGYHIIYLVSKNPPGFHFIREDKNLEDVTRIGWSHRDITWDRPEKIENFPEEGTSLLSYRFQLQQKRKIKKKNNQENNNDNDNSLSNNQSLLLTEMITTTYDYEPVCVFFVRGHGFNLTRGTSMTSDEFDHYVQDLSSSFSSSNIEKYINN